MKLYKIYFDATMISLLAETKKEMFTLLQDEDDNFFIGDDGTYKYRWDEDFSEDVQVDETKIKKGIIQWESH